MSSHSLPIAGQAFLDNLLRQQLVTSESCQQFLDHHHQRLGDFLDGQILGNALVEAGVLTRYQLERILIGNTHGLILGNHRILDRLGSGAMGVVFLGEHIYLKRRVAIKVLPVDDECSLNLLERFYAEMRVLAELHHPNIVMAYDAGKLLSSVPGLPTLLAQQWICASNVSS